MLVVVADDLTGAADSAARCFGAGLPATIYCEGLPDQLLSGAKETMPRVISCTTDSRHRSATEATQAVRHLLEPVAGSQGITWYKKIDSTLRGHLGEEIDAMLDVLEARGSERPAVICPAFPAQGRGLEDGRLVFDQQAGLAADRTLSLPERLAAGSRRMSVLLSLRQVRDGVEPLRAAMSRAYADGARLLVVDALREEDLTTLLDAAAQTLPDPLFVGSAGLVGAMARRLVANSTQSLKSPENPVVRQGPTLVAAGSGSAMAHKQIAAVRGRPGTLVLALSDELNVNAVPIDSSISEIILHLPPPLPGTPLEGSAARQACRKLADCAIELFDRVQPGALLLVGGDTTQQVLAGLQIRRMEVVAELQPGMPLCVTTIQTGSERTDKRLAVVCKSGNHGDVQSLMILLDVLRAMDQVKHEKECDPPA